MSSLARLQENFQSYLLRGDRCMAGQVVDTATAPAEQRLKVYANAYCWRLLEALATGFPVLHNVVGDAEFDRLGRAYIDANPSEHPSLRWFGRHLSAFLRRMPPYAQQPVLAEIAAFEWAQGEVFDAEDKLAVSIEAVAAIPPHAWPGMRLELHPSVQRLTLMWNVTQIWQAIDQSHPPPRPQKVNDATTWLLWRSGLEIRWRSLEPDEAWAMSACTEGRNFGDLCEGLCHWIEESSAAMHAAGMLRRWVSDGLVARVQRS